jgi:Ca2+-binding RTX toxin-like protein
VLIGDPGGAQVFGQFNVAIVVDVTGSIGPDNIVTLNAAVESLVQQIIDEDIADKTVIRLITFAVRSGQTTSGLESGKTFTWDGTQFVAADGEALADAIDEEVADPDGSTDFEPPLQDAADFFNGLNGGTGPAEDDVNRIFFLTDGQDNSGPGGSFDPDNVPDLYGPTGLIAQENLEIRVFGIVSSGGVNSGFDPDQLNLLDDGLPPQPGEPLHEGADPPVDQVEADIPVIGFDELDSALTDELLATLLDEVGGDTMSGGDGDDIIFGDVPNTGALATAEEIGLPPGSGWFVFEALEAGQSPSSPDWDRGDTITYLRDPANQSVLIGAGRGEDDTIDGGAGDDVIFGQGGDDSLTGGPGADTFVYTLAADEDNDQILDFSMAEGDLLSFVNVTDADASGTIGIEDVVDSFVDGGVAGAVDTVVLGSGTTIMITDVNGILTDLASLEANSLINGAMA